MSDLAAEPVQSTPAFEELRQNLEYARGLIKGGRLLERLQVSAFDVSDLYRAAWVQAVSALDHWVHHEVYDRAVALAVQVSADRPAGFRQIGIPMALFEDVHHHQKTLGAAFREHLRGQYGHLSYQHPDKIKQAFQLVTDLPLWPEVAKQLSVGASPMTVQDVKSELLQVVLRRHKIAHEADRDPTGPKGRVPITDGAAIAAIDLIERLAGAIREVLGPIPIEERVPMEPVESADDEATRRSGGKWTREEVQRAVSTIADDEVRWALEQLLHHADERGALFRGGVGPAPSAGLYYWLHGARRSLWSLYVKPEGPAIALSLGTIATADDWMAHDFLRRLRIVPSFDAGLLEPDEVVIRRYPEFDVHSLVQSPEAVDELCRALDSVIEQRGG
jgi:hypothetical protein